MSKPRFKVGDRVRLAGAPSYTGVVQALVPNVYKVKWEDGHFVIGDLRGERELEPAPLVRRFRAHRAADGPVGWGVSVAGHLLNYQLLTDLTQAEAERVAALLNDAAIPEAPGSDK